MIRFVGLLVLAAGVALCMGADGPGTFVVDDDDKPAAEGKAPGAEDPPAPSGRERIRQAIMERVQKMDTNGDGKISEDEWTGPKGFFQRLDRDGDGMLTEADRSAPREAGQDGNSRDGDRQRRSRRDRDRSRRGSSSSTNFFSMADTDGDGSVSSDEMQAAVTRLRRADANGDGKLSKDEYGTLMNTVRNDAAFKSNDKDGNGKITPEEWRYSERYFERADANSDGVVDKGELTTFRQSMRGRSRSRGRSRADTSERTRNTDAGGEDKAESGSNKSEKPAGDETPPDTPVIEGVPTVDG